MLTSRGYVLTGAMSAPYDNVCLEALAETALPCIKTECLLSKRQYEKNEQSGEKSPTHSCECVNEQASGQAETGFKQTASENKISR